MVSNTGRISIERSALDWFLVLRVIVATLVVGAGIMIIQLTNDGFNVRPLYSLLALSGVTGAAAYAALRTGAPAMWTVWALSGADLLLETAIVHFSGGVASQFTSIFCLTIVASAFLLGMRGGIATAAMASLCFVFYGLAEGLGAVTPPGTTLRAGAPHALGLLETYMHVSLFFLVGAMGGYLANRIHQKRRELKNAETELEQLKVDTDYIVKSMSSGILVVDSSLCVMTINPAAEEMLGVKTATALGKSVTTSLIKTAPELVREMESVLDKERSQLRHEVSIQGAGGKLVPLGTSTTLLRDAVGDKRGAICVFQNLAEVHEMRERVRKADRLAAIGELSAGIAHELRNPLASISGSIEMLAGELEVTGEHKHLMELVMRESDRLDRIISDFLDYARLRAPVKRPTDIGMCLEDVILLLKNNVVKSQGIDINLVPLEDEITVRFDDDQMRQVFLNLAVNGCEAMTEKGRLDIDVTHSERWVKIAFRDEGPGIEDVELNRLFEPFFTTKDGGTGLGLAIANKIVESHGGRIDFRNRETGGAEFVVGLPIESVGQPAKETTERVTELV